MGAVGSSPVDPELPLRSPASVREAQSKRSGHTQKPLVCNVDAT